MACIVTATISQAQSQCVTCSGSNTSASIGENNSFSGPALRYSSFITGKNSTISNNYSAIIGSNSTNSGQYSAIIGSSSTNSGMYSYIIGYSSIINSFSSYILGEHCTAANSYSMLMGYNLKTTTGNSFAIGYGNLGAGNELSTTVPYSLIIGFKSKFPTMFIGPTPDTLKSGRVGIGNITNPLAKLHIKADEIEDASLLLDAPGPDKFAALVLNGYKSIIKSADKNSSLYFLTGGDYTRMVLTAGTGKVGIGDFSEREPEAKLHIKANVDEDATLILEASPTSRITGLVFRYSPGNICTSESTQPINFYTGSTNLRMKIDANGNVGIGTSTPGRPLHVVGSSLFAGNMYLSQSNIYVDGEIKAKKFMAVPDPWADYVFAKDYSLLKLEDLEEYIIKNHHLPDVPTATQVKDNGIELAETISLLLSKIEELTLYTIQQQKEINELKKRIDE